MGQKNTNLHAAKAAKNDEFYTQLSDIEKELKHYKDFFKGKVVYCNCDDPKESNFFKFFSMNFEAYGLKKLITTGYKQNGHGVVYIYEGDRNGNRMVDDSEIQVTELQGDGDFRSEECVELLKQADVVVTNPPFSLFREYVKQLMAYAKKFLIIGSKNAITFKEIFPFIKDNKLWIGMKPMGGSLWFPTPENQAGNCTKIINGVMMSEVPCCWFTNISNEKRNHQLDLYKHYTPEEYPKYDNYDAINVDKVTDIPEDYDGVMGVPITFLDKYCPTQFEIIGIDRYVEDNPYYGHRFTIDGKETYARILIRKFV
ncbi:MAG: adenine-specific methyltransferase EcoRI family protein [Bacteroidales bacterium]|nr:adenine-specific methyltransferase EcoRI family protein [Bacteroidales bacterium]